MEYNHEYYKKLYKQYKEKQDEAYAKKREAVEKNSFILNLDFENLLDKILDFKSYVTFLNQPFNTDDQSFMEDDGLNISPDIKPHFDSKTFTTAENNFTNELCENSDLKENSINATQKIEENYFSNYKGMDLFFEAVVSSKFVKDISKHDFFNQIVFKEKFTIEKKSGVDKYLAYAIYKIQSYLSLDENTKNHWTEQIVKLFEINDYKSKWNVTERGNKTDDHYKIDKAFNNHEENKKS